MVGANIRKRRIEKGMTQQELADKVEVVKSMICQIERGSKTVSLVLANDIARVLECSIQELLTGGEK